IEGMGLIGRHRVWWVQLAAMHALAILASCPGDSGERYHAPLRSHWRFMKERLIDPVYGGFYPVVPQDLGRRGRLRGWLGSSRDLSKGNIWKDASHEADTLLATLRMLSLERRALHDPGQGELEPAQPY
ncbi:MAG TPA: AGE family epimerase/isomerase, partial [Gemmatimonadota bacterium]|nr:AGE family epimerase/isomerase [Gemmatimonadota bacterium]